MDIFDNPIFRTTVGDFIKAQATMKMIDKERLDNKFEELKKELITIKAQATMKRIDKERLDNKIEELKKELITINDSPYTGLEQIERITDLEYMIDWLIELKNYRKNSGD